MIVIPCFLPVLALRSHQESSVSPGQRGGWSLIHQPYSFSPAGTETGHAWAEREGLVYEPVWNKFFLKNDYYTHREREVRSSKGICFFKVDPIRIYSRKEAGKNLSKFRHWGLWNEK